jgi:MYXO-CTERM domain-containing protein
LKNTQTHLSLVGVLLLMLSAPASAQVLFTKSTIAELGSFQGVTAVEIADIDGDGDLDVIGAAQVDDEISWWSNVNGDATLWSRNTIASNFDGAYDIAVGDIDADGDLDVVGVAISADEIRWWEQDASGTSITWIQHSIATGFTSGISVELADIDGDSDLDVVAAANATTVDSTTDDVTWWSNDQNGASWTPTIITSALTDAYDLAVGDIDADGDQDVVAVSYRDSASKILVLKNSDSAGGTWTSYQMASGAAYLSSIALGDLDGDSDLDVAYTLFGSNPSNGGVYARLNANGGGQSWAAYTIDSNVEGASAVRIADIDGDGDLDLAATAHEGDRLSWWANEGLGYAWSEHTVDQELDGALCSAVADLDGDGEHELLAGSEVSGSVQWWDNQGGYAAVWAEQSVGSAGGYIYEVGTADFDGDGDLDYFNVSLTGNHRIRWWENETGNATSWTSHSMNLSVGAIYTLRAGDLNDDGGADLISGYGYNGVTGLRFFMNNCSGSSCSGPSSSSADGGGLLNLGTFNPNELALEDLDGDNDLDIVMAGKGAGAIDWIENDGTGLGVDSFSDSASYHSLATATSGAGFCPYSLHTGDVNSDSAPDVVALSNCNSGNYEVYWWENSGAASSWTQHLIGTVDDGHTVRLADLDGDNDLDVLASSEGEDGIVWWANDQGDGSSWTRYIISGLRQEHKELLAHDLDEDGDLDVVATSYNTDDVIWWSNDQGDGLTWSEHVIDANFYQPYAVAVADIDGDGDTDVLGGGSSPDLVWWDLQSATFSSWSKDFVTGSFSGAASIELADLDGDLDVDLLTTADGSDTVSWWSNNGGLGAQWEQTMIATSFDGASSAAAGDIDGDGSIDVVGGAESASDIIWWSNDSGVGDVWSREVIDGDFGAVRQVRIGDIDGDGDLDVAAAGYTEDEIAWWENNTSFGQPWIKSVIGESFGGATDLQLVDLDGDLDLDVVGSAEDDDDVVWWANDGTGGTWTQTVIDNNFSGVVGVCPADIDGDGDIDVVGAAEGADDVVWWSNDDGLGTTWTEHVVDFNFNGARSVSAADFDGDGDLDIVATAYVSDDVTWWENADTTGTLWVEAPIEGSMNGAYAVLSGDVDGDGDPDVIASSALPTEISWWDNVSADLDGDGFGGGNDCDDNDATVHLGATEVEDDGIDQDCNGYDLLTCYVDADGDGHGNLAGAITLVADAATCIDGGAAPNADDCDENSATTYTGAPEIDGDGIDQDCNGFIDLITCYVDGDEDGFGNDGGVTTDIGDALTCTDGGAADYADDCDDTNAAVNPAAAESGITACADGLDNDCNGVLDSVDIGCGGTGGDDDDTAGDDDDTAGDDDDTAGDDDDTAGDDDDTTGDDDDTAGDDDDTAGDDDDTAGDDDDTVPGDDDDSSSGDDDDDTVGDDDDVVTDDDDTAGQVEGQLPGECEDGADNDADGDYDCNDADCAGAPVCSDGSDAEGCDCSAGGQVGTTSPGLLVLLLLVVAQRRRRQRR